MSSVDHILPKNANGPFVALFQSLNPKKMDVIVADFQTKKFVTKNTFESENLKEFVEKIPKFFNDKFKAIILNILSCKTEEYKNAIIFSQILRDAFASIQIPTYFVSFTEYMSTCFFIATNTVITPNETVIYILHDDEKISVFECKYTENGYDKNLIENIELNLDTDAKILRNRIIRSTNPKKIIFATNSPESKMAKFLKNKVFKNFIFNFFDLKRLHCYDVSFVVEMSKWLLDKSYTKYYFQPKSSRRYVLVFLTFEEEDSPTPHIFLDVESHESLPIKMSVSIERNPSGRKIYLVVIDPIKDERVVLQEIDLLKKCHSNEIILKIDSENIAFVEVRPFHIPKLLFMPKALNNSVDSHDKHPFIGIYGNYSVICYCKNDNENGYEFLESWNGVYGNGLYISFQKKKPVFGDAIHEIQDCNPATVIFDLINIMSMPSDVIKINKNWEFKIIKDEKNPVLLEFDTFDGSRKAASPAFLMAMLLRQHLKAIAAEIGEKPDKLGFCFFDKFNEVEEKRIKEQIQEACVLLKIFCKLNIFV